MNHIQMGKLSWHYESVGTDLKRNKTVSSLNKTASFEELLEYKVP